MLSLIDADVIIYAAGFSSDYAAGGRGFHEPWAYCAHGVNSMIDSIVEHSGGDDYVLFLTGDKSFRSELYPDYKLNRDPTHKPYWYAEIKHHLLENHNAIYADEGLEADDALGITQCTAPMDTIICTTDKDLDMIPGLHYNWSKKRRADGVYTVSELEGWRTFYKQLLKGDSTDNIPGLFKLTGKKATAALMKGVEAQATPLGMYNHVLDCYEGDTSHVETIAPLLWIWREEGRGWARPDEA